MSDHFSVPVINKSSHGHGPRSRHVVIIAYSDCRYFWKITVLIYPDDNCIFFKSYFLFHICVNTKRATQRVHPVFFLMGFKIFQMLIFYPKHFREYFCQMCVFLVCELSPDTICAITTINCDS